jgi:hypothetical protein
MPVERVGKAGFLEDLRRKRGKSALDSFSCSAGAHPENRFLDEC